MCVFVCKPLCVYECDCFFCCFFPVCGCDCDFCSCKRKSTSYGGRRSDKAGCHKQEELSPNRCVQQTEFNLFGALQPVVGNLWFRLSEVRCCSSNSFEIHLWFWKKRRKINQSINKSINELKKTVNKCFFQTTMSLICSTVWYYVLAQRIDSWRTELLFNIIRQIVVAEIRCACTLDGWVF